MLKLIQKQPSRGALRKSALKICSKFIGEHPCWSVVLIKLLRNFIEVTLWHGCSPVNLLHIFWTHFSNNTSGRLLLLIVIMLEQYCVIYFWFLHIHQLNYLTLVWNWCDEFELVNSACLTSCEFNCIDESIWNHMNLTA